MSDGGLDDDDTEEWDRSVNAVTFVLVGLVVLAVMVGLVTMR